MSHLYRPFSTLVMVLALCLVMLTAVAQDSPLPLPPETDVSIDEDDTGRNPASEIVITRFEPSTLRADQGGTLTIYGENFTTTSMVRLRDVGVLTTTYLSRNLLQAVVPQNLPPGNYRLIVMDDAGNEVRAPGRLVISAPPITDNDNPTPAPVQGRSAVVVRGYRVTPSTTQPGGVIAVQLELFNQGTQTAFGVTAALESSDRFVPSGVATALAGDIPPGATQFVQLNAAATQSVTNGANTVPVGLNWRGADGESLSSSAIVSVNVSRSVETSLLTLMSYTFTPEKAVPGEIVTVTVEVYNAGTQVASNALLRFTGDDSVLQAGPRGDTALIGNVFPGGRISIDVPMRVSARARAGMQIQPISISYQQDTDNREFTTTITIDVDRSLLPEPLLLLRSYSTGKDMLAPGDTFTLTAEIENIGSADASRALIVFGSTATASDDDNNNPPGSSQTGSTPSAVFAAVGTGDTRYLEVIEQNGTITLEQEFLVNGQAKSGIYSLPISVRYEKPDGSNAVVNLQTNLLVIAQPRLQTTLQAPLPDSIEVGQPLTVAWQLQNLDTPDIRLGDALVSASGGEVVNGAQRFIGTLRADRRASFEATVIPFEEGTLTVVLTLQYLDDMNRQQEFVYEYNVEVFAPFFPPDVTDEPEIEFPFEPGEEFPPEDETPPVDFLQAILFGLLGLGQ